jgi:hypothetical protein
MSFSTVLALREFLSLEWMKPIVEKFRLDATLDVAILKRRTATLCKSAHWHPSLYQYCNMVYDPLDNIW